MATAGDVNGDGYSDVIVGAHGYDGVQSNAGWSGIFWGNNDLEGESPLVRQRRAGDTGPLAALGASTSLTGVNLQVNGRSPFGRTHLRIEYEIQPVGTRLDGTGLQHPLFWTDSGAGVVPLAAEPSTLEPGTAYHWRLRIAYRPTTTPFQPHGPWLTLAANGPQETDFRTERDTDADAFFDRLDNCTLVANPDQRDTDVDGYGNICDADLNNSGGIVNFTDLALFRLDFGTIKPDADFNGSGGIVNFADLAIFRSLFGRPPGAFGIGGQRPP